MSGLALGLLWLAAAQAQPEEAALLERQKVQAAIAEFKAGRLTEALTGLLAVDDGALEPADRATYRWNLARSYERMSRYEEALAAFERYLAVPDAPENLAEGRSRVAALKSAHLGQVEITCDLEGVELRRVGGDGRVAACPVACARPEDGLKPLPGTVARPGGCALVWWLAAGPVIVEARPGPEGVAQRQRHALGPGGRIRLDFRFAALLSVSGPAGAEVRVDGARVGPVPVARLAAVPGWREVTVESPGRPPWRARVALRPGSLVALDARQPPPTPAPPPQPPRVAGWLTAAGALALLGVGAGYYAVAVGAEGDAVAAAAAFNAAPDAAGRDQTDRVVRGHLDDFERARIVSYTGLGLGVVAAGLATWLLVREGPAGVSWVPGPAGGALVGAW